MSDLLHALTGMNSTHNIKGWGGNSKEYILQSV